MPPFGDGPSVNDPTNRAVSDRQEGIEALLPKLGRRVWLVHPPASSEAPAGGGDLDCMVLDLDLLWPLRAGAGWNVCQALHYDITGWYWVVERDGVVEALDAVDDQDGIGRYGFPTSLLPGAEDADALDGVRAAYLISKRLRKGVRDPQAWSHISNLATRDPNTFSIALEKVFGERVASSLASSIRLEQAPGRGLWVVARLAQLSRRMRTPARTGTILKLSAARLAGRIGRPTGLLVLIAGPDGSGKSTLASQLPGACEGLFRRYLRLHWRPGLLPRPGALLGRRERDPSMPHRKAAFGAIPSLGLLAYYWVDFLVGTWTYVLPQRVRTGLVVNERGWWDIAIDPRRYRLHVPSGLVMFLGRLIPRPDLVLRLEAEPDILMARKTELTYDEIERQTRAWRYLDMGVPTLRLGASRSQQELVAGARAAIVRLLEARTASRLGAGWLSLPSSESTRWLIPRGPRHVARTAMSVYHPVTLRRLIGWEASRLAALAGGFRVLPRGPAPPRAIRELLAPHVPPGGSIAVARANHPGRWTALLLDSAGGARKFAKIALTEPGERELREEAAVISRLAGHVSGPLEAPKVTSLEDGLLLMEAIHWRPRLQSWKLPPLVARCMGQFYASKSDGGTGGGLVHGDFAPWNLLSVQGGWVLTDWEFAQEKGPLFHDVFHYLVQGHALLGHPSANTLLKGLLGRGWAGLALRAYAEGADSEIEDAHEHFLGYLERSEDSVDTSRPEGRRALVARRRLFVLVRRARA